MSDPLSRLVENVAELERGWERRPLVGRSLGGFDDVFGLEHLEALLADTPLPVSALRLMDGGAGVEAGALAGPRERGGPGAEAVIDPAAAAEALRGGTTLVFEELQSRIPSVGEFTRGIEDATGYRTYSAAFLTPPGARGARAHYDMGSVFMRQVHGSKRWTIGAPEEFPPSRPWNRRRIEPKDPWEVVLHEGDCLYLPRGYVHVGDATGEASLHLSIAVEPVTWHDILAEELAGLAAREPALREALPFGFHRMPEPEAAALLAERTAEAARTLAGLPAAQAWRRVVDRHGPAAPAAAPGLARALAAARSGEEENTEEEHDER
ncbi:JmjC domain-containing protein [Nocardiopsis composta]|uniref:JmjC domain-containing protein n=1 Tax=Nocardiopsis composta TaxID=157465 RepID=A0A7W8VCN3_9ACTN|nr:cupin domain-containing protein [Nocardiopsis composta]MBB5431591.1 hypothetical protein [Nocardiopsis composta]